MHLDLIPELKFPGSGARREQRLQQIAQAVGVTEHAEITNERRNRKGMGNEERLGGETRRRESDWRQKRGETKGRMPAF